MRSHPQFSAIPQPRREEWALIAAQQKKQYDDWIVQEREKEHQRKLAFKETLDKHVEQKRSQGLDEKLEGRRHRERLIETEQQMKQQQFKTKMQKMMSRRAIEEQNQAVLSNYERYPYDQKHKPLGDMDTFTIGATTEQEIKRQREQNNKIMQEELQKQLAMKNQDVEHMRMANFDKQMSDRQYALEREKKRLEEQRNMKYRQQNMVVYKQYQQVQADRERKQRELNDKFVEQPAHLRQVKEQLRMRQQMIMRNRQNSQIKDSLMEQIEKHNKQKSNRSFNANDYSYKMIEKMFEDKKKGYDKNEYLMYLKEQEAEQKRRKQAEKYMSAEEYRLNMNQLSKIVSGQYNNPNYKDRSPANIGNPEETSRKKDELYKMISGGGTHSSPRIPSPPGSPPHTDRLTTSTSHIADIKPEDLNLVRQRLEQLKTYNNILTHS